MYGFISTIKILKWKNYSYFLFFQLVLGSSFLSTAKADYCYRTNHSYGNGYSQRCSNGSSSSYYDDNNDGVYKRNTKSYGYSGVSGGYKYPSTGINGYY